MSRRRIAVSSLARLVVGIALLVYLAASGAIEWAALAGLLATWEVSLAALLLLLLVVALVSWRLCLLLRARGLVLPLSASIRLTLIGAFFSAFLPGSNGGDVARIYLASRPHAGRVSEIATIVLLDRAVGLLSLLLLPVLIVLAFGSSLEDVPGIGRLIASAGLTSLALASGLALAANPRGVLRRAVTRLLRALRLDESHASGFFDTLYGYRRQPTLLLRCFLLSLVIQVGVVAAILLLAVATDPSATSWRLALVVPLGLLVNALPLTPGGLGVGEAAFEVLFRALGASGGAETILAWRMLTTLIDLCGGAILLAGRTDMSRLRREAQDGSAAGVAPSLPGDGGGGGS